MDNVKVGQFIKKQLKEKGITQDNLAERLGISSSAVSQGLSGKNSFDVSNLMVIASILDLDLDVIVNAGKTRETNLERISKLNVDEYLKEDPDLHELKNKDSKDNTLLDYLIVHENMELLRLFLTKRALKLPIKDLRVSALILSNYDMFKDIKSCSIINLSIPNFKKVIQTEALDGDYTYFVDKISRISDKQLFQKLPFLTGDNKTRFQHPIINELIKKDNIEMIEYVLREEKDTTKINSKNFFQHHYHNFFKFAITHHSEKSIHYFYNCLNEVKYEDFLSVLTQTSNIEYVQNFMEKYPEKKSDRYNQSKVISKIEKFNNSSTLLHLIQEDNIDMFNYSLLYSNQEALNLTLEKIPKGNVKFIVLLLKAGAIFQYKDTYSGNTIKLEQITEIIRYLLK